jgi:hypothetical protein
MTSEIKKYCIIFLDGWVINKVFLKGANYCRASRMIILEDFDMLWRNIEGILEEVVDAIGIFYATSELPRTVIRDLLIFVDTYQQREDGAIGGTVCHFRKGPNRTKSWTRRTYLAMGAQAVELVGDISLGGDPEDMEGGICFLGGSAESGGWCTGLVIKSVFSHNKAVPSRDENWEHNIVQEYFDWWIELEGSGLTEKPNVAERGKCA